MLKLCIRCFSKIAACSLGAIDQHTMRNSFGVVSPLQSKPDLTIRRDLLPVLRNLCGERSIRIFSRSSRGDLDVWHVLSAGHRVTRGSGAVADRGIIWPNSILVVLL